MRFTRCEKPPIPSPGNASRQVEEHIVNAAGVEGLSPSEHGHAEGGASQRRKLIVRTAGFVLWFAILSIVVANAFSSPSFMSVLMAVVFTLLFVTVYLQIVVVHWAGARRFKMLNAKLRGAGYISNLGSLPNRNYLLSELRREMPRSRGDGTPFTVLVLSLEDFDGVRERRGDDFADRALYQMVETLRRATRNSDFLAHLSGERFCVLLVDCRARDALLYLERLPGTIPVSDGRHMYDVPITARLSQYDMESIYATDVLADAEGARPLQRKAAIRPDIRIA